jgi:ABC-2 type transport system ATP-binding protein
VAANAALTARGVTRRYGARVALEPTDLDVSPGEIVVLLGPNGDGKSTLLALLAGALPPTGGEVATGLAPAEIGWAPQRPAQYRRLSARENLELFARLLRLERPDAAAGALLAEFELPADQRPSAHLSVGNPQRLNLAIAFLGEPRLLLLDEPTASLDPEHARGLWERVRGARTIGAAAIVATHFLDETVEADRVLTLRDGRLVEGET